MLKTHNKCSCQLLRRSVPVRPNKIRNMHRKKWPHDWYGALKGGKTQMSEVHLSPGNVSPLQQQKGLMIAADSYQHVGVLTSVWQQERSCTHTLHPNRVETTRLTRILFVWATRYSSCALKWILSGGKICPFIPPSQRRKQPAVALVCSLFSLPLCS